MWVLEFELRPDEEAKAPAEAQRRYGAKIKRPSSPSPGVSFNDSPGSTCDFQTDNRPEFAGFFIYFPTTVISDYCSRKQRHRNG